MARPQTSPVVAQMEDQVIAEEPKEVISPASRRHGDHLNAIQEFGRQVTFLAPTLTL